MRRDFKSYGRRREREVEIPIRGGRRGVLSVCSVRPGQGRERIMFRSRSTAARMGGATSGDYRKQGGPAFLCKERMGVAESKNIAPWLF